MYLSKIVLEAYLEIAGDLVCTNYSVSAVDEPPSNEHTYCDA